MGAHAKKLVTVFNKVNPIHSHVTVQQSGIFQEEQEQEDLLTSIL